MKSFCLTSLSS